MALTALTRDGGTWQVVVSLAVAEVSARLSYMHPGTAKPSHGQHAVGPGTAAVADLAPECHTCI